MSKNEENLRLRAWNNKVQNDLSGSIAGIGYMTEQQRQFLQDCFEAVLKHQELTDNRFQDLDKLTQDIAEKYTAIQVQQAQHHREVRDLVHSMETRYAEISTKLTELNSKLTELENKLDASDEEPKSVLPRKDLHPWFVKHIFKADQVYREAGAWYLLRKHNGNAQSLGCSTLRELYARNKIQLRKNKLEDELSSLS